MEPLPEIEVESLAQHDQAGQRSLPRCNRGVPPERLGINDSGDHTKALNVSMDVLYMMHVPTSFEQASESEHGDDWKAAMDDEMESINADKAFTVTRLPPEKPHPQPQRHFILYDGPDNCCDKKSFHATFFQPNTIYIKQICSLI